MPFSRLGLVGGSHPPRPQPGFFPNLAAGLRFHWPDKRNSSIEITSSGKGTSCSILVISLVFCVEELLTPKEFKLYFNFPNPFNPSTTILYALPEKSHVSLQIYDILGKRIKLLVSESQNMGHHSKIWDGTNEQGEIVSGGVYIYVLNAGSYYDTKKMIYMK